MVTITMMTRKENKQIVKNTGKQLRLKWHLYKKKLHSPVKILMHNADQFSPEVGMGRVCAHLRFTFN